MDDQDLFVALQILSNISKRAYVFTLITTAEDLYTTIGEEEKDKPSFARQLSEQPIPPPLDLQRSVSDPSLHLEGVPATVSASAASASPTQSRRRRRIQGKST